MIGKRSREIKERLFEACEYLCFMPDCYEAADDLHHILPQTEVNRAKFPLYIDSPFNLMPICNGCHMNKPLPKKPSLRLVQVFENYLTLISISPLKLP